MLRTSLSRYWSSLSKAARVLDKKQRAVLRMYKIFGMARECFISRMASWPSKTWSLDPRVLRLWIFLRIAEERESESLMGLPKRVASLGSVLQRLGAQANNRDPARVSLISSVFSWLRLRPSRAAFDRELQYLLSEVLNINFVNYAVWTQATLPVKYGGIGLRSAVQLAPCAFLASAAACTNCITTILPSSSPAHQLNIAG